MTWQKTHIFISFGWYWIVTKNTIPARLLALLGRSYTGTEEQCLLEAMNEKR